MLVHYRSNISRSTFFKVYVEYDDERVNFGQDAVIEDIHEYDTCIVHGCWIINISIYL